MTPKPYGLMAAFLHPEELLAAARAAHQAGYREMDAYSPFPVEGVAEALGFEHTRVSLVVLIGGMTGAVVAYGIIPWMLAGGRRIAGLRSSRLRLS
jgi:hypothetical protein